MRFGGAPGSRAVLSKPLGLSDEHALPARLPGIILSLIYYSMENYSLPRNISFHLILSSILKAITQASGNDFTAAAGPWRGEAQP